MSLKQGWSFKPAIFFWKATTADAAKCTLEIMIQPPEMAAAEIALSRIVPLPEVSVDPIENERRPSDCDCIDDNEEDVDDAHAAAVTLAVISNPEEASSKSGVYGSLGISDNTSGVALSIIELENKA